MTDARKIWAQTRRRTKELDRTHPAIGRVHSYGETWVIYDETNGLELTVGLLSHAAFTNVALPHLMGNWTNPSTDDFRPRHIQ